MALAELQPMDHVAPLVSVCEPSSRG